ncbi:hypothetical protein [Lentilactobacillus kosonis]|uniref:Uncharacterized protein n=1 Tax=Lentilactobacillus kosonis TaxID=2810561 RepID=A0A401FKB5_9LACO|nr:hypothetical protein [Lentilactobacillus kosonis]GAY72793.1 hypothetical protein NBRC111893_939 [Lentilactobacillus kosonis]
MSPSDQKRKFILEFLIPYNHEVSMKVFNKLINASQIMGYSIEQIINEVVTMDSRHDSLLNISYIPSPDGQDCLDGTNETSLISDKGLEVLDVLRQI